MNLTIVNLSIVNLTIVASCCFFDRLNHFYSFSIDRITDDLRRVNLTIKEPETFSDRFRRFMYTFFLSTLPLDYNSNRQNSTASVVIDGDSLAEVLKPGLRERFLELCTECKTVICCRVTPYQKVRSYHRSNNYNKLGRWDMSSLNGTCRVLLSVRVPSL